MLELNNTAWAANREHWIDQRVMKRTQTFLSALHLREQLSRAQTLDSPMLVSAGEKMIVAAIKATGFWAVWLYVFKDYPGFQQTLGHALPGTANQNWVL